MKAYLAVVAMVSAFAFAPAAFAGNDNNQCQHNCSNNGNNGNNGSNGNNGNNGNNGGGTSSAVTVDVDANSHSSAWAQGGAGGSATNTNTNNANNSSHATGGAGGTGGTANNANVNSANNSSNATGGNATGGNATGGNATGGSSSADNNGNNNGNNNSSSSNSQSQSQSANNESDNSNSNNSSQNVDVNTYHERNPVSTAYAAPLAVGEDTCMGSSSMGAQAVSFGLSIGSTWQDRNCQRLKNSRQLVALGYQGAATALMCVDDDVRHAMAEAGTPCPAGAAPVVAPVAAVAPPAYVQQEPVVVAPTPRPAPERLRPRFRGRDGES